MTRPAGNAGVKYGANKSLWDPVEKSCWGPEEDWFRWSGRVRSHLTWGAEWVASGEVEVERCTIIARRPVEQGRGAGEEGGEKEDQVCKRQAQKSQHPVERGDVWRCEVLEKVGQ
jgi:hypothetical protein